MAHVIEGGTEAFDALVYGRQDASTAQFLREQIAKPSNALNEAGRSFFERANEVYERVAGSMAMQRAKAAAKQFSSIWQTDEIRQISELASLRTAPLTMQRWIMAEPTTRKLYHKQCCDGYDGSYEDVFPGDIGESHYDWRRANNGFVHFVKDDNGDETEEWYATTYFEDLLPDDEDLDIIDQTDIQQTWDHVRSHIFAGSDPTSKWGSDL